MKLFIAIIVVVLILLSGGLIAFGPGLQERLASWKPEASGTPVRIEEAVLRELIETVKAPGEIEPHTKIEISSEVVSKIELLPFREGDLVEKGDLVVKLDDKDLQAALLGAKAAKASAEANLDSTRAGRSRTEGQLKETQSRLDGLLTNLEYAQRNLARKQQLYDSGDIPRSELDLAEERVRDIETQIATTNDVISQTESLLDSADAQIKQAQAAVMQADADIVRMEEAVRDTTIYSPITGKVTLLNAEEGETVVTGTMNNPGTVIMVIADLARMRMIAQVAESDVTKLRAGQKAQIVVNGYPDDVFEGVVSRIALQRTASLDGTGFFEAEVEIKLDGRELRSGHQSNVDIEIRTHQGVVVPSQAVVDRVIEDLPIDVVSSSPHLDRTKKAGRIVYRVVDGKAVATPVRVGPSDLTHTLITAGLNAGERIVTGPYKVLETIKHDQAVKDMDAEPAAKTKAKDAGTSTAAREDEATGQPDGEGG